MANTIPNIPLFNLALSFIPILASVFIFYWWSIETRTTFYALSRMLFQLILVGYLLNYLFAAEHDIILIAVLCVMILVSAWIALRPLAQKNFQLYLKSLLAIAFSGTLILFFTLEFVLELDRWLTPQYLIPLAGMIYSNAMNSVSLAAERFDTEIKNDVDYVNARKTALQTSLIPLLNMFFAVGLVSLPGMMTGQILAGVSPLVAVRYQIVIMSIIFAASAVSVFFYLLQMKPRLSRASAPSTLS